MAHLSFRIRANTGSEQGLWLFTRTLRPGFHEECEAHYAGVGLKSSVKHESARETDPYKYGGLAGV